MADMMKKVPVREQDPKVRATNFEEVCLGYNKEEAMEEATRCLNCKNAKCIQGCPVSINIPAFIHQEKKETLKKLTRSLVNPVHFRLSVDVFARRNPSVRENVSVESKVSLFPSENWSVSLLTMHLRMILNQKALRL